MDTTRNSPEREPLEPAPSLEELFDGFADIVKAHGEYVDPLNGRDAPSFDLPTSEALKTLDVKSISFATPFRDDQGHQLDASVHLVWQEGPIDKNITLGKADDESVDGLSLTEFNDEGERDDICDPEEHLDFDRLYDYLDDMNLLDITEDERRTAGKILAALRREYGQ